MIILLHLADVNECTQSTHNCHQNAVCQNTNGGFNCSCNNGFEGNGINCTGTYVILTERELLQVTLYFLPSPDVNECISSKNNCNRNALCVNTAGSSRCICKPGFLGNGVTCRSGKSN